MAIKLITNQKIAEISAKGNQEKWFDKDTNCWYKLDLFGYEALAETVASALLKQCNIEELGFQFVEYQMEKVEVRKHQRTGCSSKNFLRADEEYYNSPFAQKRCWYWLFKRVEKAGEPAEEDYLSGGKCRAPHRIG